ncbi:nitronate monooxygenase [Gephyromycinifex aptenodytis]|uniref:nitronate monooxygenase n=1 Tax=Gephyromycinifex aptenodytis TaxID=2716227 RepID=UPI001447BB2B|nr:nitronate monooxygenase [Gephyromycinifex aptenodytis]
MSNAVSFQVPRIPVCVAPMAGGPSTPELVAAAGDAGGFGFLAAGYRRPLEVAEQIVRTAELSPAPFGVNLFVPEAASYPGRAQDHSEGDVQGLRRADEVAAASYRELLAEEARRLQARLPSPDWSDTDAYDDKLALLEASHDVSVVSFTFGCPTPDVITRLHEAGRCVAVTVTTTEEARTSVQAGADVLVVQGFDAGGHRGTHRVLDAPNELDHLALVPMLTDLGVPLIAAGGITTAGDTRRALAAGACAVQVGTAFLLTPEAGTSAAHRMALSNPAWGSVVTRAFSGRPARGLRNGFVERFDPFAPALYPVVDQLTKPLRAAAARQGELDGLSVWAGSGWRAAREEPAAAVVARLAP